MKDEEMDPNEMLRLLLRIAGGRQPVPEQATARVRSTVHGHWKKTVRARRRYRAILFAGGAVALSLGMYLLSWYSLIEDFAKPVPVGIVETIKGIVITSDGKSAGQMLTRGGVLMSDSRLTSDPRSQVLLRFLNGLSLRMDTNTQLVIKNPHALELLQGAVYLDCAKNCSSVTLLTPLGVVRDNGTQFEVRLQNRNLRVMVREGSVLLEQKGFSRTIGAGKQVIVDQKGSALISSVQSFGPDWNWLSNVAPSFPIEGKSLADYLRWVAREMGWTIKYSHPRIEGTAPRILLHGSVTGLSPQETPGAVLPICGFDYTLLRGVLTITPRKKVSS